MNPSRSDILWPGVYGGPAGPNAPLKKVGIADITAALIAASATTEVVAFDTTAILELGGLMDYAAWNLGVSAAPKARPMPQDLPFVGVFLTLWADQDLQLFHRTAGAGAVHWRDMLNFAATPASPTEYAHAANNPGRYFIRLGATDHQLVLKTKATPPTAVELSIRLTNEYYPPTN